MNRARAFHLSSIGLALAIGLAGAALGRDSMSERLSAERVSDIEAGSYVTETGHTFVIEPYGEKYLLRLPDSPEVFVLTVDRSLLGAKVLRYDTGATALRVSVWGGLTLYTADAPGGVPASRQGDAPPFSLGTVSPAELGEAMKDEASHLGYVQTVAFSFAADSAVMKADGETRAAAFDTLSNTGIGIERFLAAPAAKQVLTSRISTVRVTEGAKPTLLISGHALMVSFVPGEGYDGRASSHAIAHSLGQLLQVQTPE